MTENNFECPNCGASMNIQGFGFVCDFCGTHFLSEEYVFVDSNNAMETIDISERYAYLRKNEQYIKSCKYVKVDSNNGVFRARASPAYCAKDSQLNKIQNYSLYFDYLNSGDAATMYMVVHSAEGFVTPYISILLDELFVITPRFERWEGDLAIFQIGIAEFERICESRTISFTSNLMDAEAGYYEEFIPYCCRFYNAIFNKNKFLYSIHQNLISDKDGK